MCSSLPRFGRAKRFAPGSTNSADSALRAWQLAPEVSLTVAAIPIAWTSAEMTGAEPLQFLNRKQCIQRKILHFLVLEHKARAMYVQRQWVLRRQNIADSNYSSKTVRTKRIPIFLLRVVFACDNRLAFLVFSGSDVHPPPRTIRFEPLSTAGSIETRCE